MKRKDAQRKAIRERAERAIADLYHNATPNYPRLNDADAQRFEDWFRDAAESEIEYIRDGGAHGNNYRKTLEHPANAGKYKSERARAYYVAKGMRDYYAEIYDCGMLTGWRVMELAAGNKILARRLAPHFKNCEMSRNNALWECVTDWGKLYQYGRGGRTLAPDGLIVTRGGGAFALKDCAHEGSITLAVELIQVLESFNRHVRQWCKSVPQIWTDYENDRLAEERSERARRGVATRERNAQARREASERAFWNARDVITRC